jgi:hypothetical protein
VTCAFTVLVFAAALAQPSSAAAVLERLGIADR